MKKNEKWYIYIVTGQERKMHMEENMQLIRKTLKKYSQEHLLNGYDKLPETKQKQLLEQIEHTDFELINSLYNKTKEKAEISESEITPIE